MTGDKGKLHSYNALEKEKNVSFRNDTPVVIKGKGFVFLKEKVEAGNVMYVDSLVSIKCVIKEMKWCFDQMDVLFVSLIHERP